MGGSQILSSLPVAIFALDLEVGTLLALLLAGALLALVLGLLVFRGVEFADGDWRSTEAIM